MLESESVLVNYTVFTTCSVLMIIF